MSRIQISIGKRQGWLDRTFAAFSLPLAMMAIPILNHQFTGGSVALDVVGALLAFLWMGIMMNGFRGRLRICSSIPEAANWVASLDEADL